MGKVCKFLAETAGLGIVGVIILLILFGIAKLTIFLFTVAVILVGFALALVFVIALFVALFEIIKGIFFKKNPEKKTQ